MNRITPITNSEWSTWAECNHEWLLRYGLGLRPVSVARPMRDGKAWHRIKEVAYKARDFGAGQAEIGSILKAERDLYERSELAMMDPLAPAISARTVDEITDLGRMLEHALTVHESRFKAEGMAWDRFGHLEEAMTVPVVTPTGRNSPVLRWAGRLDGSVRGSGEIWVVETKLTDKSPDKWILSHGYLPQVTGYAILLGPRVRERVAGVCFQVAKNAVPVTVADYKVNKDGTLAKRLPANADAATFTEAAKATVDAGAKWAPWYNDTLSQLIDRPVVWESWHWVRFGPGELDRARAEMYYRSILIRRMRRITGARYAWIKGHAVEGSDGLIPPADMVHDVLSDLGPRFPRSEQACYKWGRPCAYMDVCRFASAESLSTMRVATDWHEELEGDDQ